MPVAGGPGQVPSVLLSTQVGVECPRGPPQEEQDTVIPDVAREAGEASLRETARTLDVSSDPSALAFGAGSGRRGL